MINQFTPILLLKKAQQNHEKDKIYRIFKQPGQKSRQ